MQRLVVATLTAFEVFPLCTPRHDLNVIQRPYCNISVSLNKRYSGEYYSDEQFIKRISQLNMPSFYLCIFDLA